jgi:hypothetical protein
MSSDEKPLKGILKKGDGSDKKKNTSVALFQVDEGHDAESKEDKPKRRIIEGKDGILVKKSDGSMESGDSIKSTGKSRKSGRDHQMISKSTETSAISPGTSGEDSKIGGGGESSKANSNVAPKTADDAGVVGKPSGGKDKDEKCVIC